MFSFLRVHVRAIEDGEYILLLPNGQELRWPQGSYNPQLHSVNVGDELILTLTAGSDVINELLAHDNNAERTKNNTEHSETE